MAIKAVFFDVGATLIHDNPSVPYMFARMARKHGFDLTDEQVLVAMPDIEAHYAQHMPSSAEFWCSHKESVQAWVDLYCLIGERCGIEEGRLELAHATYDEYLRPESWLLFDDVEDCLQGLRDAGVRMAAVSNWDGSLPNLLEGLGLLRHLDEVVSSAREGIAKPDPRIFELALSRMRVKPEEVLHVGDSVRADGDGAAGAGIQPLIIDRKGALKETCPYRTIASLREVLDIAQA